VDLKESALNYREAVVQRLRVLKPCTVLDAGTGAGIMTKALSSGLDSFVVSIDANKRVFSNVCNMVDRHRVDFVTCDFAHLPFEESVFCCVVCDLVISTSREWKPFLIYAEFNRALRAGSSLFITDYYPEKSPRTKEARLAAETSRLCRTVSRIKGVDVQKSVPPESSVKQLRKAGFTIIRKEKIKANEAQEWKRRVMEEYFNGMQTEISGLNDSKLKTGFMKRLKQLKSEIDSKGRIRWGWGANYLIEATK
jgi:ubiquinone/menaquinone biosynthesis C-methylase UbiE